VGRYLVRATITAHERRLGPAFLRVHRSGIVRCECVIGIERGANGRYWVLLRSGARVAAGCFYRQAMQNLAASTLSATSTRQGA
jgi:DNA-binding LytR/AlgR family response regulator